jgi:hypothetical protein
VKGRNAGVGDVDVLEAAAVSIFGACVPNGSTPINWHRPHASLNHQTPISRAGLDRNNLLSHHTYGMTKKGPKDRQQQEQRQRRNTGVSRHDVFILFVAKAKAEQKEEAA